VKDSVNVFIGSEETEPGDGWPYDLFLSSWNKLPSGAPSKDVANALTQSYQKYYQAKSTDVTLSAFDLNFLDSLNQSIRKFSNSFKNLGNLDFKRIAKAAQESTHFTDDDYVDLGDFLDHVKSLKISKIGKTTISEVSTNLKSFIVANNTVGFEKAQGASIWIPTDSYTYSSHADRYSRLSFDQETHWGDVAKAVANSAK